MEVEIPPAGTWLAYLAWQARQAPFGGDDRGAPGLDVVRRFESELADGYAEAADVAGLGDFAPPDMDALAALARPHLSPSILGGYGHVELGFALQAVEARRAHVVISVKSFGCIPSAGIADAILPTVLGDVPYLSLEVCADGEAARESRLAMRVAAAIERAEAELAATDAGGGALRFDPLRPPAGSRRHASTLAEVAARA